MTLKLSIAFCFALSIVSVFTAPKNLTDLEDIEDFIDYYSQDRGNIVYNEIKIDSSPSKGRCGSCCESCFECPCCKNCGESTPSGPTQKSTSAETTQEPTTAGSTPKPTSVGTTQKPTSAETTQVPTTAGSTPKPPHCSPLGNEEHGQWAPGTCASDVSDVGQRCSLQCTDDYQLRGSAYVDCTDDGWSSTNGKFIPKCVPVGCVGEIVEDILNKTLSVKAGLLFVVDESGSLKDEDFIRTKEFVKDIVTAYPLSENRSAGVITFSRTSMVRIHLSESSTSSFMTQMDAIKNRKGRTDILGALNTAIDEINGYHVHDLTLVFLLTDGEESTDGTPAAERIKSNNNNILFAIGVGRKNHVYLESLSSVGDDGIRLFFHTRDYSVLESIGNFINPPAGPGTSPRDPQCKNS